MHTVSPLTLSSIEKLYSENVGCTVSVEGVREGINLGLNFTPSKIRFGELEIKGVRVYYPDVKKVYGQEFQQLRIIEESSVTKLSDVLLHFMLFISTPELGGESIYSVPEINEMIRKYYKARGFSSCDFDSQFVLPKL